MKKFVILPDTTCDLSEELRNYFGIEDYMYGYVHINDGQIKTRLDWNEISREEFYGTLSNKKNTVSSAVASPEEFYEFFARYAKQGYDIISMSLSSKISAYFNEASKAAEMIRANFPECRIYCVDTMRMSGSLGLLVAYAGEMRKEGKSFDEVVNWLEENKHRVHQMGPIDDLTFVARRGRISTGKAIMGQLIGVKPMGDCNKDGYVTVLSKVKGIKKALAVTVQYLKHMATDVENQYIFVHHSAREEYGKTLKEMIEKSVPCKKVFLSDVFACSGTNIGPGMVSIYFLGEPISDDCVKEKEALTLAISEC